MINLKSIIFQFLDFLSFASLLWSSYNSYLNYCALMKSF